MIWNELLRLTGSSNGAGDWYLWWSGFFADVVIFAGFAHYFHTQNCHVTRCRSFVTHPVVGTPYRACKTHHPSITGPVTALTIEHAHQRAADAGLATHRPHP